MISFDPKARRNYLTGFRKRKQARRKQAMMELLEKERLDRIEAKKDHREGIKQRWRDVQRAGALTNKAFEMRGIMDTPQSSTGPDRPLLLEDGAEGEKEKAPVTVAFELEDDDPFGDCEVTTTAFEASSSGNTIAENAAKLWPALLHTNISSSWTGGRGTWEDENADADEVAAAKFAKQRRRVVVRKQEEKRQHDALQRRVAKVLGIKRNKKGSKSKTGGGKSTHGERKKQAQARKKKHG